MAIFFSRLGAPLRKEVSFIYLGSSNSIWYSAWHVKVTQYLMNEYCRWYLELLTLTCIPLVIVMYTQID